MDKETNEKINKNRTFPVDLYIKRIDNEILETVRRFNYKTLVCYCDYNKKINSPGMYIFKYKYNPEKDFKGPLVKLSSQNLDELAEYIRGHPNRIQGIILDFNEFRNGSIDFTALSSRLPFFQGHNIPVLFGSGADSANRVLPAVTLKAAIKYLTPMKDPDNSKIYKKFYKNLFSILTQGKYFEAY